MNFASSPRKLQLCAFTLIEMLAAIAIISGLAVLLLSAIGKFKERALVTSSVSSLRSVVLASTVFANDNKGTYGLYGVPARQTMGMTAEATAAPPRTLFPQKSVIGRHPTGGGEYLEDTLPFHNRRVKSLSAPANPREEFGRSQSGRQEIGYYYYSLPSGPDELGRTPYEIRGKVLSNQHASSAWGRTPLYSDIPVESLAESYGLSGDSLVVAHLDGSCSVRSLKKSTAQPSWGWRLYYLATGEGIADE